VHLRATLEQERSGRGDGGAARRRARDVYRRINNDERGEQPPPFARASQNVAAAAILLWTMPAPLWRGDKSATSFTSFLNALRCSRPRAPRLDDASPRPSRLWCHHDKKESPQFILNCEGCQNTTRPHRCVAVSATTPTRVSLPMRAATTKEDGVVRGYHPRRGRRYDSEEDMSPSPEPLGPRVFSKAIRRAQFLA
jgi:hypothetical protein